MKKEAKTAVIIANMGGPGSLDDVQPYLRNIFSDPAIIDIPLPKKLRIRFATWLAGRRAEKSRLIYERIGGKSPLMEITGQQARALEENLRKNGMDSIEVHSAMRYWHPFLDDIWAELSVKNIQDFIVVSLYPFYSFTTSGSLVNQVENLHDQYGREGSNVTLIDRFGGHPMFINAIVEQISEKLAECDETVDIILSVHSIPAKSVRRGDPYQEEVEFCFNEVQKQLGDQARLHLSYQSKLGPVRWLEPSTPEMIKKLTGTGIERLWIYPLGFVADNSETLYEINQLYKEQAEEQGVRDFFGFSALNTRPLFIETLTALVMNTHSE